MLIIIDYKMGNLRSILNKFTRLGINCKISSDVKDILSADKLVLPGVGHFKKGINNLKELDLITALNEKIFSKSTPILGICLGMQLFTKYSEEGNCEGLGWFDAEVVRFNVSNKIKYKVPHIGWNNVLIKNSNNLDAVIQPNDQFYFVHSYHLKCYNSKDIWMTTSYEYEFVSAIHKENIYGTQFHPEKSHDAGYNLLRKFVEL